VRRLLNVSLTGNRAFLTAGGKELLKTLALTATLAVAGAALRVNDIVYAASLTGHNLRERHGSVANAVLGGKSTVTTDSVIRDRDGNEVRQQTENGTGLLRRSPP
jgi:hypothetical protein